MMSAGYTNAVDNYCVYFTQRVRERRKKTDHRSYYKKNKNKQHLRI